jgi:heat shock protein HtpX
LFTWKTNGTEGNSSHADALKSIGDMLADQDMAASKVTIRARRSMTLLVILMIMMATGSYAVILLIAAACIYLPYLLMEFVSPGFYTAAFFLSGMVIAGILLWSMVPRVDRFNPTGLRIERASQPRLFAEIDDIALMLDEPLPQEVYLIGEVGAWVADRGGLVGFGSRRVMGVGLPLLAILNVSQFRGVMAHEFAHYYAGDTRLGPWIYKTRTAIIRGFQNIEPLGRVPISALRLMHVLVSKILELYFATFLRATSWISRQQEYRADELACIVGGSQALIEGLRAIHGARPAWQEYWNSEALPVVRMGSLPPIGEGFSLFTTAPNIYEQIKTNLDDEIELAMTSPYDSHPTLRDRVAAAEDLGGICQQQNGQPALSLLDNPEATELLFIQQTDSGLRGKDFVPVRWDEVGKKVTLPAWRDFVSLYEGLLQGLTLELLPSVIPQVPELGSHIQDPTGMLLTPAQRTRRGGQLLAAGFAVSLINHGWKLRTQPGVLSIWQGDDQINPFLMVEELMSGELSAETWATQCCQLGISQLPLLETRERPVEITEDK